MSYFHRIRLIAFYYFVSRVIKRKKKKDSQGWRSPNNILLFARSQETKELRYKDWKRLQRTTTTIIILSLIFSNRNYATQEARLVFFFFSSFQWNCSNAYIRTIISEQLSTERCYEVMMSLNRQMLSEIFVRNVSEKARRFHLYI